MNESSNVINDKLNIMNESLRNAKSILTGRHPYGYEGFIDNEDIVGDPEMFFGEMAEIYPKYNSDHNIKRNRFVFCVYGDTEGPVPHAHVYYEHKGENGRNGEYVAYVRLDKAEYAPQHDKATKILNSQERKALMAFLTTEREGNYRKDSNGEIYQITCWEEAVYYWLQFHDDAESYFEVDPSTGRFIMPNYLELK